MYCSNMAKGAYQESADIEVRYATNRVGPFTKKITLTTNEGGEPRVIKVTGTVLKEEVEESVPAGEQIIFLFKK